MSYDLEFKTVQISVKDTKIWVNAPQCILRIAGLDPKWIHKLSMYKPEKDLADLLPLYESTTPHLGDMIDIRIPKQRTITCPHEDCHYNERHGNLCEKEDVKLIFDEDNNDKFDCDSFAIRKRF